MSETDLLPFLPARRLADAAFAPLPAWVWAPDAGRLVWANAVGAAMFGAPSLAALAQKQLDARHPAVAQLIRLAGALPESGTRLERLKGFASGVGRLLTCNCSRLALADGTRAILVGATEPAGPNLSLGERARRLLEGFDGPFAAFSPDGALLFATPQASGQLGGASSLAAAGAAGLGASALAQGVASGEIAAATLTLQRMGSGNAAVLLATLAPLPAPAVVPEPPPVAAEAPSAPTMPDDALVAETLETERPIEPADEVAAIAETLAPPPLEEAQDEHAALDAAPAEAPDPAPVAAPDPAPATAPEPTVAAAPIATPEPKAQTIPERRHPLRFVWEIDADGRFTVTSPEFIAVMGDGVAAMLGRSWPEVASALDLDPEGQLAPVLASRDTFSGIALAWPVAGMAERLPVELSGLPVFDRERAFRGYRGFGVCRELARLDAIVAARRAPAPPADAVPAAPDVPAGPDDIAPTEQAADTPGEAAKVDAAEPGSPPAETVAETPPAAEAETQGAAAPPAEPRPQLTVVPAAKNVVPFRPALPAAPDKRPVLTPVERNAFQEIARALGARLEGAASEETAAAKDDASAEAAAEPVREEPGEEAPKAKPSHRIGPRAIPSAYAAGRGALNGSPAGSNGERTVLDRVPVGVLIYRGAELLHANRALLEWTGYEDVKTIAEAGGLERLFAEPGLAALGEPGGSGQKLAVTTRRGAAVPVECRLFSVSWHGATALLIVLTRGEGEERMRAVEEALRQTGARVAAAEAALAAAEERLRNAELDHAQGRSGAGRARIDPRHGDRRRHRGRSRRPIMLASTARPRRCSATSMHEIAGQPFLELFAPESQRAARDYLDGLTRNGVASVLNDGREVIGRERAGRAHSAVHDHRPRRRRRASFCAVLRDITQWKRAEEELTQTPSATAERASSPKIRFPRQGQPRDPHAAQRHHRLLRSDDARSSSARSATSATATISRTSTPPATMSSRWSTTCSTSPRSRPASSTSSFASVRLNELVQQMRRADAAAGEPRARHHPLLAVADAAAGGGGRALDAPDRAQPAVQLDQVHRRGRPGDRLDRLDRSRRGRCCACATPASA